MTVRVGCNLMWLVPGVVGGSEEYTTRLLAAVAERLPRECELTLFVNRRFLEAHPRLGGCFPTAVAPVTGEHKAMRVLAETTWLARQARARRLDIVHHMGGILPAWRPTPCILTIHDLQPLTMPANFSFTKRGFSALAIPLSVRAATTVITLAEFTRHELAERLGAQRDRVVVIPPGFDAAERGGATEQVARVRSSYGIGDRPYFLYPAITYPHKNHITLVRALARLAEHRRDVVLVLTGGSASSEGPVRRAVAALGLDAKVLRTGRIPEADLDGLYRGAAALTFPSLSEGFGLPVLEAMSRGCPVIAADATALAEVVGDAGIVIDPVQPDVWAEAMSRVLDDEAFRSRLVEAGFRRARAYTWDAAADALVDVYLGRRP